MEAINKNKEEIKKIDEAIKYGETTIMPNETARKSAVLTLKEKRKATIKTSILWCEWIFDYLNEFDDRDILEQLQTHLNWLKEMEKK